MTKNTNTPMLFYPDSLWIPDMISGAAFLYFQGPILFTIPSASSIGILGGGPSRLVDLVKKHNPKWAEEFRKMFDLYVVGTKLSSKTMNLLKPLHGHYFKWIQLVFPHTTELLDEAEDLQRLTGYEESSIINMINPLSAGDSLAKHILFEMYIQTLHSEKSDHDLVDLGIQYARRAISRDTFPPEYDTDAMPLYEYCAEVFSKQSLTKLLCKSYMLRLLALRNMKLDTLFISNSEIMPLLTSMLIETDDDLRESQTSEASEDIIAWEIFRQILSPAIDPLDEKRVELIAEYGNERKDEISRLRNKCSRLAHSLSKIPSVKNLEKEISGLVEREVHHEIADLLQLDHRSLEDFITSVFSDEKTWLSIAAFISAFISGHEIFKAGAAIAALCNIGSKAFKAASVRRKKLRTNDFTLLYNINKTLSKAQ